MKTLLIAAGGRGKVEPFLALGCGLRQAGSEVLVAAPRRFSSLAGALGVEFAGLDDSVFALQDRLGDAGVAVQRTPYLTESDLQRWLDSLAQLVDAAPDIVVLNSKALGAAAIAEKLRVPVLPAQLVPTAPATSGFAAPGAPLWTPRPLRRWTWRMTGVDPRVWRTKVAHWREYRLGLPPSGPGFAQLVAERGVLSAWSRHLLPAPVDWPTSAAPLGFWTLPSDRAAGLSESLERFLSAGEPPVLVVLDDLLGRDLRRRAEAIAEGLRILQRRGLLVARGSGLPVGSVAEDLYLADQLHFPAVMPRIAAIAHHGSIGLIAAALTAGVPQVTYPLVEDQLFWAGRLHRIGLAPEPLDRLSPHSLAYALEDAVGLQPIVNETQAALRGEDGIAAAITRIENADTQPDNG